MNAIYAGSRDRKKNNSKTPAKKTDNVSTHSHEHVPPAPHAPLSSFYSAGPVFGLPVQTKVVIGRVDDPYEREADSVADRVTVGHSVPFVSRITPGSLRAPRPAAPVQRKEEEEEKEEEPVQEMTLQRQEEGDEKEEEEPVQEMTLQRQEEGDEKEEEEPVQEMAVQRQKVENEKEEEKEEKPVQAKAASPGPGTPSAMHTAAAGAIRSRGPGEPMKPSTRNTLESRMGVDLSDVRVHSDSSSQESAGALKAKAFTHKEHIWLGRGQSQDDVRLMAHETSHVLQQDGIVRRKPLIQRAPEDGAAAEEQVKDEEKKPEEEKPPEALKPPEPAPAAAIKAPEKKPEELETKKLPEVAEGKKPEAVPPAGEGKTAPKPLPVPVQKPITVEKTAEKEATKKEEEKEGIKEEKKTEPAKAIEKGEEKPAAKVTAKEEPVKEEKPAVEQAPAAAVEAAAPTAAGGPSVGGGPGGGASPAEKAVEGGVVGGGEKTPKEERKKEEVKPKGKGEGEKDAAETPSPESDPRFQGVIKRLDKNAKQEKTHEPAAKKVGDAQAAAVPPENDRSSRAQAAQVEVMDQKEAKKPETDSFLAMLRAELERVAPKNMEETEEFKKKGKAGELKDNLTSKVTQQKEDAAGDIKTAAETEPNPDSVEPKEVVEMPADPADPKQVNLNSRDVLPVPKKEEDISVEENTKKADELMAENDIDEDQLKNANEPQFDDALKSKKELEEHAAQVPEAYREEEKAVVKEGEADVEAKEKDAKEQMRSERDKAKDDVKKGQDETKKKEEEERKKVADDIQGMYDETKKKVEDKLNSLDEEVNRLFDEGEKKARENFETYVDDRMSDYKWDRYISRFGGGLLWAKDKLFGMPDEVNKFYEEGRDRYIKEMDTVLVAIADRVETVLKEAKDEIAAGKKKIAEYVEALPKNLKKAGEDAQSNISEKFDELQQGVDDKKKQLAQQMAKKYNEAREKLDARIEELIAANKGLVDAFIGKIKEIIKMLKEFKDRVMGILKQGADSVRKIVKNPIGFLKNILAAVKKGFGQFVDNILTHLKKGLMEWLFGAVAGAGIEIPSEFSVKAIFGLVMQVLGFTRDRIRAKMVKFIGEKNVGRIEKAWEVVSTLISEGPAGLWKKVKEYMGNLKEMVMGAIQDWLIAQVIKQAVIWVISLFNPASALLKAIKLIYDVVMFFVENIERILQLVEAVVQSVSKIVAGQIGDAANWIEGAMGKTIPIIISFLARILGLGGISGKIKSIIKNIQKKVDNAVDKVIKKIVGKIKGVFGKGKKAVKKAAQKIKNFIYPKEKFKAGKEPHTIFFEGKGPSAKPMVASGRPQTLTNLLNTLAGKPENKGKTGIIGDARTKLKELDKIQDKLKKEKDEKKIETIKKDIRSKLKEIAPLLAGLMEDEEFGTKADPIELDWPKPASSDYPPLYFGPKSENRIPQSSLKKAKEGDQRFITATEKKLSPDNQIKWKKSNHQVKKYEPHGSGSLPEGGGPIGLTSGWHVASGKELKLPKTPEPTPGGETLNSILRPYGFSPSAENLDADHVVEMQMGGKNVLGNLWPLNSTINRRSGKVLSSKIFSIKKKKIPMSVLKARAKDKDVHFKITSTQ